MGAVVTVATTMPADMDGQAQDLVMVEERDTQRTLSKAQRSSSKIVNVGWLKHCLVAGAFLPPAIMSNEVGKTR